MDAQTIILFKLQKLNTRNYKTMATGLFIANMQASIRTQMYTNKYAIIDKVYKFK